MFIEIIIRMLGHPVFILDEIAGAALVIVTFAGLGASFIRGRHLRIDIIITRLPYKWRLWVEFLLGILALGFCIFTTVLWWDMTYSSFTGGVELYIMKLPVWPIQVIALVGWIGLIIAVTAFIVNTANQIFGSPLKE